jgi:hypothetical protein
MCRGARSRDVPGAYKHPSAGPFSGGYTVLSSERGVSAIQQVGRVRFDHDWA